MKHNIHPQYYNKASVRCACGHTWTTGSTAENLSVEICSNCHPFYTGNEKVLDTRGRIDKFKKRLVKAEESKKAKVTKKPRVTKNKK